MTLFFSQKSVTNYRGIFGRTNTPPPVSPGQTQIESMYLTLQFSHLFFFHCSEMLRELLGPLTEKVERLSKSHHKRYHELKRVIINKI